MEASPTPSLLAPWSVDLAQARAGIATLSGLRVAVVGEAIIDEYAFCDTVGKSGKEPTLVTRFVRCEAQAGGVLAVANHVAQFCAQVEVVSALGDAHRRESFVRDALQRNVRPSFITKSGGPTIVKRRYVDSYSGAKMLGVYQMNSSPLTASDEAALHTALEIAMARADLVIVADYGHGLLGAAAIEHLCAGTPFLAVNTQLNADNHGYHALSKYRAADYACLHEGELRLDARDEHGDLSGLLRRARERLGARGVMATLGKQGTWLSTAQGDHKCPALARDVVERVGAGDAVLALTSAAMAAGLAPAVVGLLGNLAGAQAVAQLGNRASIQKDALVATLGELLSDHRRAA